MSDEQKDKIRQKALGRKPTDETKEKIRQANKIYWNTHIVERTLTEEGRKKMSLANKGKIPYNKGISKYNYVENRVFECFKIGFSERQIQLLLNISKGSIYRLKRKYKGDD